MNAHGATAHLCFVLLRAYVGFQRRRSAELFATELAIELPALGAGASLGLRTRACR